MKAATRTPSGVLGLEGKIAPSYLGLLQEADEIRPSL